MPPRVEVDSHAEDGLQTPVPQSASNDEAPSPLFRDNSVKPPPPSSSLDRRQSDPHFAGKEMALEEEPAKQPAAHTVSRITAIIGPESAYVKTTGDAPSPAATVAAPVATQQATKPIAAAKKSPYESGIKIDPQQVLARARRFVSKQCRKVKARRKKLANKARSTWGKVTHKNAV